VVIAALNTVGPVDAAVRASTAALAAALPLNVAGILLLRLIKDVNEIGLDDLTLRAFQETGLPQTDAYAWIGSFMPCPAAPMNAQRDDPCAYGSGTAEQPFQMHAHHSEK
jgi:hypothetical protein